MQLSNVIRDWGLAASQNFVKIELLFTGAAAGTEWSLVAGQKSAQPRVVAVTGDGAIDLATLRTDVELKELVKAAGTDISTELTSFVSTLKTYFTNIPAAADGAKAIAFLVGGLGGKAADVLAVEVEHVSAGTSARNSVVLGRRAGPAAKVTSESSITLASNTLCMHEESGVLFGTIAITDVADIPEAAPVKLTLIMKV